ncbi:SBBP repeat-containing protein [Prochlorococcus sp. MIT 1318]|uniref:SBBP repeat-containing protein n=1 Tax=Prochlorococcus sp. MIT 1318 TaxID=3082531 RepID=UPI0039B41452
MVASNPNQNDLNLDGQKAVDGVTKAWTQLLGTPSSDYPKALTTGSDGSIYIAGSTHGNLDGEINSGGGDAFLTKYDSDGTKDWTQLLGTTLGDYGYALTTGSDGSIYIAGSTTGDLDGETNNGSIDAFLTKYDSDGTKDWTQLFGTTSYDYATALTTGSDGSIYISGYTHGNLDGEINSGGGDAFLTKYDPDGTKDWTQLLGTTSYDDARALTTGSDGSIYIAGITGGDLEGEVNIGTTGTRDGGLDAFLTKYNPDGTKDWTQLLGSLHHGDWPTSGDYAYALTTGSDGSIYIAGDTSGDLDEETNNGSVDAFLTKYDSDGTKDWTNLLGTSSSDWATALTTGRDGSIYIAGSTRGDLDGEANSGSSDAFLTKYDPDGTKDWTQLFGTTSGDNAYALTTGSDGSIYIAGNTNGDLDGETNSGNADAFLTKFVNQSKLEVSYELRKAKRKDGSSSTETDGIALETDVDTTIREDPLKSTAIKGIGATDNDAYILDILAKNVAQGYTLESTDITLKFNTDLFGSIDKDQIQLSSLFPVANAIHIDNDKGEIRIVGAGLNHISGAGAGIASGENKVFASIALNFDETALAKYTTGSATAGKLLTYDGTASGVDAFDGTLEFDLSVNRDSTVFSKSITETSGLENAEISTLRDLNGSVKAIKDSIALYEGQVDLSQTGDLTFASNRTIGVASGGIKTNLIRAGSTIYSDVTWKNTGNVAATDITIKNLATDATAVGKVITSKSGFLKIDATTDANYSKNGILDQTALDQIDATNNKLKGGSFVTTQAEEVNGLKIGDYDPNKQEEKTVRIAVEIGDDQAGKVFNAGKNLYRMEVTRKDQHGKNQTDEYDVGTNVGSKNLITFQGDLNFDGTVGMKDLAFLNAGAARQTLKDVTSGMKDNLGNDIGTQTKQAEANTYVSDVDADFNGVIDIADLKILDKDWGRTLHTGDNAFHGIATTGSTVGDNVMSWTVGDNQMSWTELNAQNGINESWDNTSFEKQNTLEAKASSGGYDAPLEHVQNTNTSNSNIDSDNAARDEVVTGGTNNPNPSVSGGGGNYTEDITGTGLNDDIMGGSST